MQVAGEGGMGEDEVVEVGVLLECWKISSSRCECPGGEVATSVWAAGRHRGRGVQWQSVKTVNKTTKPPSGAANLQALIFFFKTTFFWGFLKMHEDVPHCYPSCFYLDVTSLTVLQTRVCTDVCLYACRALMSCDVSSTGATRQDSSWPFGCTSVINIRLFPCGFTC